MLNFQCLLCIVLTLCVGAVNAQSTDTIDRVLALVNGQPVTQSEVERRVKYQLIELKKQKITPPSTEILRAQLLENAVLETLLLQQAKQERLMPSDELVNTTAQSNASRAGLTMDQLREQIAKDGATLIEYLNDLKNELGISRLREREVGDRIKITDTEIDRFLRSPNTGVQQEYKVKQIVLPKNEGMSAEALAQLNQQAQNIRSRLLRGEPFEALAKEFSAAEDAVNGGVMGFKTLDKLPEMYSLIVENLGTGGLSDVLESSAGLHILQLEAVRLQTPGIQQTHARHILIRVDSGSDDATALEEIKRIYSLLVLNKDRFPDLAKRFSQDGSAQNGGDLGWSLPGDMVVEFDSVMDKLVLSEISLPFKTQFGWHVLQVLERQVRPLSRERLRNQTRAVLRQRKQEDAFNEWLQELRAKAFIEYKKTN